MCKPGIPCFSDRIGAVLAGLLAALAATLALPLSAVARDAAEPVLVPAPAKAWATPRKPGDIPLPRSARLAVSGRDAAACVAVKTPQGPNEALAAVALGVTEVLCGRHAQGAGRLAAARGTPGPLADVAAYYQGLGLYLADDAAGTLAALAGPAGRPASFFLGRDALYLAMEAAARLGDDKRAAALAESWLTDPDPALAPQVWLRAATAAANLGQRRKADDFLRHLSVAWPASRAAAIGDALARALLEKERAGGTVKEASGGQGAALDPSGGMMPPEPPRREEGEAGQEPSQETGEPGWYDPDAPASVLLRAEALVEKGSAGTALTLLDRKTAFDAGQAARAEYIRGKALYRLRRPQAAAEAFVRAAAVEPTASLAFWARYHEARCLWRSREPEDIRRMEELLRQVLDAPMRDDPLREVAARHLTLLLAERGRFAEALDAAGALRGLAVSPDLAAQGASLAAILRYVAGDMEGAAAELAAFAKSFPEDDWLDGARYWRGKALAALGRTDEAAAVWVEAVSRRPNTYYGGKAAAALAGLGRTGQTAVASPVLDAPRCPGGAGPSSPSAQAALDTAHSLDEAGLPALAEMLLEFAARSEPDRADLAMAHIRAAEESGRRPSAMRTAWRTFGGCLLRGTPEGLAPLRSALFPRAYAGEVAAALAGSGIDPDLIYSLIRQESFFDPKVVSGAGAVGLMQLMPDTAAAVGRKIGIKASRADLFNPGVNVRLGVAYFRERLERAGSLPAALAGYNAGENRVAMWSQALAPLGEELFIELIPYTETRDYVRRITANAMMYDKLYPRTPPAPAARKSAAHAPRKAHAVRAGRAGHPVHTAHKAGQKR